MTSDMDFLKPQPVRGKLNEHQLDRVQVCASVLMGRLGKKLSRSLGGHLSMIRDHPGTKFRFDHDVDMCFMELIGFLENSDSLPKGIADNYRTSTEDALVVMIKYFMENDFVSEDIKDYGLPLVVYRDL